MSYLQKLKKIREFEIKSLKLFEETSPIQIETTTLSKKEHGFHYYIYQYEPNNRHCNTDKYKHWLRPKFNKLKK